MPHRRPASPRKRTTKTARQRRSALTALERMTLLVYGANVGALFLSNQIPHTARSAHYVATIYAHLDDVIAAIHRHDDVAITVIHRRGLALVIKVAWGPVGLEHPATT